MNDYTPNSHKYKEEQRQKATEEKKKVEKVTKGVVKTKTNEVRKFADIFISEDIKNVKSYVFMDVLVPAIKKAISDIVTDGIDMILYGGTGKSGRKSVGSKISYRNYYDKRDDDRYREENTRTRTGYNYFDITVETRGEAEEVISQLEDLISLYGMASVADLYDLVGIAHDYTDVKYGWMNVRNAEVVRVRDGYKLKMPKAIPLN